MSKLYLNIPVKNTAEARNFYEQAGFVINKEFSNPMSETVVINDNVMILLVNEEDFKKAAKRDVAASGTAEVVMALELDSRADVNKLVDAAVAAGAEEVGEPFEHDGMYTRIFRDRYGHQYNIFVFL